MTTPTCSRCGEPWRDNAHVCNVEALARATVPRTPAEMVERDGLYVCGDTKHPDALVPVWVHRGKSHSMTLDETLSDHGWLPTWVCYSGPHVAPAYRDAAPGPSAPQQDDNAIICPVHGHTCWGPHKAGTVQCCAPQADSDAGLCARLRGNYSTQPYSITQDASLAADRIEALVKERDEAEQWASNKEVWISRAETAEAELAACRADAERYRWLRENGCGVERSTSNDEDARCEDIWLGSVALDHTIDTAIAASGRNP